jgi:hypothetical protein
MALLLPSVAMTCKGIRGVANASSSFFAPVFIKGVPADAKIRGRSTGVRARIGGNGDIDLYGETLADDFYSVLGLTSDATADEIKRAYYSCMKSCHPDLSGNHPESTDFCMCVNEIYEVPCQDFTQSFYYLSLLQIQMLCMYWISYSLETMKMGNKEGL